VAAASKACGREPEEEDGAVRRLKLSAWTVPVALTIAAVLPITGWAAERCVLGEDFTATW
jgi:hypothetical protein